MATITSSNGTTKSQQQAVDSGYPNPEVSPSAGRRKYSAPFKVEVLQKLDHLGRDESGAYLRSEGLYWSIVTQWRRERDEAYLASLGGKKRGPKPAASETAQLKADNEQLKIELERSRLVIDMQKKVLSISEIFAPRTS